MGQYYWFLSQLDEVKVQNFNWQVKEWAAFNEIQMPILNGLLVLPEVWRQFKQKTNLDKHLHHWRQLYDSENPLITFQILQELKQTIANGEISAEILTDLISGYRELMINHHQFRESSISEQEIQSQIISYWLNRVTPKWLEGNYSDEEMNLVIRPRFLIENEGQIQIMRNKTCQEEIDICSTKMLTSKQMRELNSLGQQLLNHFYFPKIINFWIVGGDIFFERIHDQVHIESKKVIASRSEQMPHLNVVPGFTVYPGYSQGPIRIINRPLEIHQFQTGDILAVREISRWQLPLFKRMKGLVVDQFYDRHDPAWELARKFQMPCLFGTGQVTRQFRNGQVVELNAQAGFLTSRLMT